MQNKNFKRLITEKEIFQKENKYISNFWLKSRKNIKTIIDGKNEVELYVTLCLFYDKKTGLIKWDFEDFTDLSSSYQSKFYASLDTIDFLSNYFNFKVNFLLADRWILLKEESDIYELDKKIIWVKDLYSKEISKKLDSYNIDTFTNFWLNIDRFIYLKWEIKENDILNLFEKYKVDYNMFKNSFNIIKSIFWLEKTYYIILNYLKEAEYLSLNNNWNIFVKSETISSLNSIYNIWKYRLKDNNIFARLDIQKYN